MHFQASRKLFIERLCKGPCLFPGNGGINKIWLQVNIISLALEMLGFMCLFNSLLEPDATRI